MDFGFVEIFIFACFLLGGGMILGGLYGVYRGICSKSWPSTTGTITHSELAEEWEDLFCGSAYHSELKITYTYIVDGKKLQGKRVKLFAFSLATAQRYVIPYPLNSKVKVYYNPTKPSVAVLIPGLTTGMFALIIFGVALIISGVSLIIYI